MGEGQTFGKWLRHRRRELDLTQEEFARQVGCASITIRKLEGDEMHPSKQLAESISKQLGIPIDLREDFIRLARDETAHPLADFEQFAASTAQPSHTTDSNLPTGTLTMLFSNIGGSTQLNQKLGSEYIHLLEEYRRVLRMTAGKWNGREVDAQGDSLLFVFERAGEAVSTAAEAQNTLAQKKWIRGVYLQVRMGIHTGEPKLVDSDYVGVDVNRTSHICRAANAGQVLLSAETRGLLERHLPENTSLRDLGKYRLKDSEELEHIYQLVIAGLPSDFPQLKSLGAISNNLPIPLTSFVGREHEIEEIRNWLNTSRLVTLTGAGGSGKTRLAMEVVSRMLNQFPDGAWLIDFVSIREPRLIEQIIASTLGIREEPNRPLIQTLVDYLRSKDLILLLDNCEHLIAGCAQIADTLLQVCPQLHILATSREALGITGEKLYNVPTLTLPGEGLELVLETFAQSEAVRVFLDRALMIRPTFELTLKNASAIAKICRRLDGIPLAIELAAARVKSLSVEQIASHLDDRFALLNTGNRTALPRHQTLRAIIDWSYDLLSDNEKTLFARLSVFAGGWTLEAATEVCLVNLVREKDVLSPLLNLSDKSLVVVEEQNGETHYRFLETIREYAHEKLSESEEARLIKNRYLDFYTDLAKQAELNYRSETQLYWFKLMEQERTNVRAAFEYGLSMDKPGSVQQLIGTAFWLWFFRGPWSEGQYWVEAALIKPLDDDSESKARLLMALGLFQYLQDNYSPAKTALDQSLVIWRELEDLWWSSFILDFIGFITRSYDHEAATDLFMESLELARQTNDKWILAYALWSSGENELFRGNLLEAHRALTESVQLSQVIDDKLLQIEALRALGETEESEQNYLQAIRLYQESLGIMQEFGITTNISALHFVLGRTMQLSGDNDSAAYHLTQAMEWSLRLGKKSGVPLAIAGLGVVAAAKGNMEHAVRLLVFGKAQSINLGTSFHFHQSAWFEACLNSARTKLGEESFAIAVAEGQAMSLDQAIKYSSQQRSNTSP